MKAEKKLLKSFKSNTVSVADTVLKKLSDAFEGVKQDKVSCFFSDCF